MFNRLRNRFLLLNMIIIFVLMLVSFISIYLITYNNIYRDIQMELNRISESRMKFDRPPENESDRNGITDNGLGNPHVKDQVDSTMPIKKERTVSFSILTNSDWTTNDIISYIELDDSIYDSAKAAALQQNGATGTFRLEDGTWAYIIRPHFDGYNITFLEITSQQNILNNLIYTFLVITLVMFVFIYLISRFFADRAIKPIQQAFEKQKQFIADSSHELKTPLTVINTNVDVLLSNSDKTIGSQAKWLGYIKSETERMTGLTHDLLYLTQMDYSEVKMIYSDFNLSDTVSNVMLTMEAVIFEHDIHMNDEISPDIMIYGNSEQIAQVVMNLLDNAVKYTPVNGTIEISLKKLGHNAVLSVSNSGAGILPEHLEKIFDRFYRTDKSRSRKNGGYGLGLAIAKAIVNQHNGKISAESIPDRVTTFKVELPLAK